MIILLKFNFYPVKWEIYIKKKKKISMQKRQSNMLSSVELFLFSNPAVIELVACQPLCRKLSILLGF